MKKQATKKASPAKVGQAVEMYKAFLKAERAVRRRQKELSDFVETLSQKEVESYMVIAYELNEEGSGA